MFSEAERSILEVSEKRSRSGFLSISEVWNTSIARIDELYQKFIEELSGLRTGYKVWIRMTAGLQKEAYYLAVPLQL